MMSPYDKQSALRYLEMARKEIEKLPTTTRCHDCLSFSSDFCKHWKAPIPADVASKGCEAWKFDESSPPF